MNEKFMRHIGKPVKFTIGEDEFEMGTVPNERISDLIVLLLALRRASTVALEVTGENEEDTNRKKLGVFLSNLTKENFESMDQLMILALERANPEIDKTLIISFVARHYFTMVQPFMEANSLE